MKEVNAKSWLGFSAFLQQFDLENTTSYFNHKNFLYIEKESNITIIVNETKQDGKTMFLVDVVGETSKSFYKSYFADFSDIVHYISDKIRNTKLRQLLA